MPSQHYTPIQNLWLNALTTPQSWAAASKQEAHDLRFKLYNMRRTWRKQADPFAEIADRLECVVKQVDGIWYTILRESGSIGWDLLNTAIQGDPTTTTLSPLATPTQELSEEDKRLLAYADAANKRFVEEEGTA